MSEKVRYGWQAVLLLNTGTRAATVFVEASIVGDIQLDAVYKSAVIPTREGKGLELEEPTIQSLSLSGKMRVDDTSTIYDAFDDAFAAKTPLDVLVLNGKKLSEGARGYFLEFKIHDWKQGQGNDAILMHDFTLKPCIGSRPKMRAIVGAAGALTLTEIGEAPAA
jgi:hypothetical protein